MKTYAEQEEFILKFKKLAVESGVRVVLPCLSPRDSHPEEGEEGQIYLNKVSMKYYRYSGGKWRTFDGKEKVKG
jgi:hypothetical protein